MISSWSSFLAGIAIAAALVGLTGYAAHRVASALLPEPADLVESIGMAGIVGVAGWLFLLQVLGLLGVLWWPVVLGCLVPLTAASLLLPARPHPPPRADGPVPWGVVAAVIPFLVLAVVETLSAPPSQGVSMDSVHYHIVNAAQILNSGSIRSLPFAQPGDGLGAEPGNGSLLLLLAMLPFHNAGAVGLVDLGCAALLVLFVALLLRETGRSARVGLVGGLAVVSTWIFFSTQVQSAYSDVVALLGLVAAVTFALRAGRTGAWRWFVLAGLCLGVAMGAKMVYLLPGAAVATALLASDRRFRAPSWAGPFLLGAVTLCAAWYARNWIDAGDPIFPQTVRLGSWVIFPGLSGSASVISGIDQSIVGGIASGRVTSALEWLRVGIGDLGVTLAAIPLGMALVRSSRKPTRVLAWMTAGCLLAYVLTPYSGSVNPTQLHGSMRFLLPAVTFGIAAVASAAPRRWLVLGAIVALGVNAPLVAVNEATENSPGPVLVAVAVTAVALALLLWREALVHLADLRSTRRAAAAVVVLVLVAGIAHLQPASDPGAVGRLLSADGATDAPVVVMDVGNVAAILGPNLDVRLVAAGEGPEGAERPIWDPTALTARIDGLHPAAVVIGDETIWNVVPAGWAPPASWRLVGIEAGALVYRP